MELNSLDIGVLIAFYSAIILFSLWKSRQEKSSEDYFLASRSLIWPVIGVSIVAANLSTEQFVGMAGQGAGHVGLAVSAWQLTSCIAIVIIAFTLLPRFLKAGIYTMPEFLEYRYNPLARGMMAIFTVVIYVTVTIATVLYSGGLTLETIFGFDLITGVILTGAIAALYTTWGGLKAVAWADLFLGGALLIGGLITFALGIQEVGGWQQYMVENQDRMHMFLPADHDLLPWTGIVFGMWIPVIYYCGLNQFIVQRTLAAKTLKHGQMGIVLAAALWMLVPFAIVIPGIISNQLYGGQMETPDEAYPMLIRQLIPAGVRGFMFAAIAGAVISSLASMLNSASTIFTMDIYKRMVRPEAKQSQLVLLGRIMTVVFVVIGCLIAPVLRNPGLGGIFNYIQEFQGYISPGIVAIFLLGFIMKRAPRAAGWVGLVTSAVVYGLLHLFAGNVERFGVELHFLIRMLITFLAVWAVIGLMTWRAPLAQPVQLPERKGFDTRPSRPALVLGGAVIVTVIAFFIYFR